MRRAHVLRFYPSIHMVSPHYRIVIDQHGMVHAFAVIGKAQLFGILAAPKIVEFVGVVFQVIQLAHGIGMVADHFIAAVKIHGGVHIMAGWRGVIKLGVCPRGKS